MGLAKSLATANKRKVVRRKSETETLAELIEQLEKTCRAIYETGTPLNQAFHMAHLKPSFTQNIFAFRKGMFASDNLRSAWRSAMFRLQIEEGIDDSQETTCLLLMGPYKHSDPDQKEMKLYAWLCDTFMRPMNFRRQADEVAEEADSCYWVFNGVLPIPRAVTEAARNLLTVSKKDLTEDMADKAYNMLEPHFTGAPVS